MEETYAIHVHNITLPSVRKPTHKPVQVSKLPACGTSGWNMPCEHGHAGVDNSKISSLRPSSAFCRRKPRGMYRPCSSTTDVRKNAARTRTGENIAAELTERVYPKESRFGETRAFPATWERRR